MGIKRFIFTNLGRIVIVFTIVYIVIKSMGCFITSFVYQLDILNKMTSTLCLAHILNKITSTLWLAHVPGTCAGHVMKILKHGIWECLTSSTFKIEKDL